MWNNSLASESETRPCSLASVRRLARWEREYYAHLLNDVRERIARDGLYSLTLLHPRAGWDRIKLKFLVLKVS